MNDDLQQKIAAALEQNIPMSEIATHLASHENPEYSSYGKSWLESQAAPSTKRSDFEKEKKTFNESMTPVLDFVNQNPQEAGAIALAAYGATKIPKAIAWYDKRRMEQQKLDIEKGRLAAYEKQNALLEASQKAEKELSHTDVANMVKAERNLTEKPNPLDTYAQQKHGMPLAAIEEASGGPLTKQADVDLIANQLKSGKGITVNSLPSAVSNAPAGVPGAINPMDQLTAQPAAYPLIKPKPPVGATAPAAPAAPAPQPVAPQVAPPQAPAQPSVSEAVATGGNVDQAIKQTVADLVDESTPKPTYPKGESLKAVPPGFVFRQDVGNLDRSLGNILGKEHREYARELFNQGKPFGHSSDLNNDVSKITNQYWQKLQSEMPESLLGREARRAQNIPSDFGTFAKKTNFGQKAKIGGVAGTLFALADLANATQPSAGNAVVPPQTSEGGAAFGQFTSGKKYQAAKKRAEQADVNTLADPKTYAAVQSFLGVPPDQLGFSVMHPEYQKIRDVADPAYMASLLTALSPRGISKILGK